ncbi:MAG: TlpA family protein disulfide reductase [Aquificae bacterium]|nr:TlpA family protein disulfide reductase [Aquificota bacterium]
MIKLIYPLIVAVFLSFATYAKPKLGTKAPDFKLPDIFTGKIYTMDDFKGKVVLLNLWASWCTGCKAEMPEFFKLQKKLENRDFMIVAVSIDSSKKKALKFLKKVEKRTGIRTPFIVLWDSKKNLAKIYKPIGLPSSYLIDKKGILRKEFIGSFTTKNITLLEKEIEKLLEEKND